MWDLHENAGSVTGACVGAGGPAMQQVVEHLDPALHYGVRGLAPYVTDEPDPARVLERDPAVVLAHGAMMQVFAALAPEPGAAGPEKN